MQCPIVFLRGPLSVCTSEPVLPTTLQRLFPGLGMSEASMSQLLPRLLSLLGPLGAPCPIQLLALIFTTLLLVLQSLDHDHLLQEALPDQV